MPPVVARPLCPVCGKASYSKAGVHPQCVVARADAVDRANRKANTVTVKPPPATGSWRSKKCPKCQRSISMNRHKCDCGHVISQSGKSKS